MISKIAEQLQNNTKEKKRDGNYQPNDMTGYRQKNNNHRHNRRNNNHYNNRNNQNSFDRPKKQKNTYQKGNITFAKPNEGYQPKEEKKDKMGWDRPEVQFAAGAGTIGLGAMMAMSGSLGPGKSYANHSKNQALNGMNKYIKRNVKPLHRTFIDIATKSIKDINNANKNKKMTPSQQVDKIFKDTNKRRSDLNNKYIKDEAAKSMNNAINHNQFEKVIAQQEGRKPFLHETDPRYHLQKAKNEYIEFGEKSVQPERNKFEEYKGVIGSSILGGSGFALGVSGIHALDRSLNTKKAEEETRKKHEETFRAAGSLLIDDRRDKK